MSTKAIAELLTDEIPGLNFTLLELGAQLQDHPKGGLQSLVDSFPGSIMNGLIFDDYVCKQLNDSASEGYRYYSQLLNHSESVSKFYETIHANCCSLYEPDAELLEKFTALEVMRLQTVSEQSTATLDQFVTEHELGAIDFMRLDAQGAELDILKAGTQTISGCAVIVCEVEFIQMYKNQPLFGDVCSFMADQGFMFHKFIAVGGRTLKPTTFANNPNVASQHMWSDAVFIPHILNLSVLSNERLVKSAILAHWLGSTDVAYYYLKEYDERNEGSDVASNFARLASTPG